MPVPPQSLHRTTAGASCWSANTGTRRRGICGRSPRDASSRESPEAAAARELSEEANLAAGCVEPLLCFYATPGYCAERLWVYAATNLRPCPGRPDRDERIAAHWFDRAEAVAMCLDGRVSDAKTIAAVLAFAARG